MKHGLYFRLHPWNNECIVEMQSVCTQKNIKCATTRFCYICDKVINYFMKKIATFAEKYYVSKIHEEDKNRSYDTIMHAVFVSKHVQRLMCAVCASFQCVWCV